MEYGRYRILNQLGQGGMATVYLAEDPLLNRLVAIKVIQAHLSSNSSLMDRFTVEAKTIASLRHINIVEVFDFGVQEDQQFLVMEYIDGQNLQAVCAAQNGKHMPNTVVAAIICQAAEGLTSAEKHNVVHRDIKPENLMFNSEGALKIADFGIAHISDEQSRTQTGAVLGSPNYMSPEQIEGLKPTNQTDIFSLGGVLYYCLTTKLPFTGPSIPVTMRNICEKSPPAILDINPDADPALVQLVEILLQKDPEKRGDGARWLANYLRAFLSHHGIVDIVDHVKTYIMTLGIASGGKTMMEGPSNFKPGTRTMRPGSASSGSSGFPNSAVIKNGATLGGNNTFSKGLATGSEFRTQGTTGVMGPSSRSPVVWIGALLSICVLILAGALLFTRGGGDKSTTTLTKNPSNSSGSGTNSGTSPSGAGLANLNASSSVSGSGSPSGSGTGSGTGASAAAMTGGNSAAGLPAVNNPNYSANANSGSGNSHAAAEAAAAKEIEMEKALARNREIIAQERARKHGGLTGNMVATGKSEPHEPPPTTLKESSAPAGQTGFVLVKSAPPFAALTINGKPQGETPMNAFMEVPVGKCHVEIVHRLSPPFDTIINITPGFRREFKFKLD